MTISSSLIGAVSGTLIAVFILFCTGNADFNSSNHDANNLAALTGKKDIVIDAVHDYLQGQEQRLATLRKRIEDYSTEHEKAIRKVARILSAATQESSMNKVESIQEKANEGDLSHLAQDAGTNYEKLCSGEIVLHADIQKKLKCQYVHHGIPFLKLAPFKEEVVYLDPRIVVYHDVIYEEEIEVFKTLAKPKLKSATVRNEETSENYISAGRVAESGWLEDHENKHVELLGRRVEHMTSLTVDTAETLQIAYYGFGGFYLPHWDFALKTDVNFFGSGTGNRIATVLFYMNDVEKGGATAFTQLNFTIWPKKGSAVFWHNLKRNGEGELSTMHAACPVLSGTKWIATKWLHEHGQEFRRPCTLLENE